MCKISNSLSVSFNPHDCRLGKNNLIFLFIFSYGYESYYQNDIDLNLNATSFYQDFLNELVQKYCEISDESCIPLKLRLEEAITAVKGKYSYNPVQLFQYLYDTLQFEAYLIDQSIMGGLEKMDYSNIKLELDRINCYKEENKNKWDQLKELYEGFFMKVQDFVRLKDYRNDSPNGLSGKELESNTIALQQEINCLIEQIAFSRLNLIDNFKPTIEACAKIQDVILNKYLKEWKDSQTRSRSGLETSCKFSLDTIQCWCEVLVAAEHETKWQILNVIEHKNRAAITEPHIYDYLPELAEKVDLLMKNLMELSLVIVQQPPESVKKSTKFETTVRLLTGNFHGNRQDALKVKVTIESGK